MDRDNITVAAVDSNNILDRLSLCWGHLDNWKDLEIVERSRRWLVEANAYFPPTTFIAYKDGTPAGMIESIPYMWLTKVGLCPCRVDDKKGEVEERYVLGDGFEKYLFITCISVTKENQGKGIGGTLLRHFLNSAISRNSDGALVYVTQRDKSWSGHIHWPAGPKEFYLKAGFTVEKELQDPPGFILHYEHGKHRQK